MFGSRLMEPSFTILVLFFEFNWTGGVYDATSVVYTKATLPYTVATTRPSPDKPNPKLGIGMLVFSPTGRYLASRNGMFYSSTRR
jgi:hypothetical protein